MTTKRINLFLETDIVDVIDAFAEMNKRSRTHVIHELLRPSVPALKQLLKQYDHLSKMSDSERLTALAKLNHIEEKLTNNARNMPKYLEGITK